MNHHFSAFSKKNALALLLTLLLLAAVDTPFVPVFHADTSPAISLQFDHIENDTLYIKLFAEHCVGMGAFDMVLSYDVHAVSISGDVESSSYFTDLNAMGQKTLFVFNKNEAGKCLLAIGFQVPIPLTEDFYNMATRSGVEASEVDTNHLELCTFTFKIRANAESTEIRINGGMSDVNKNIYDISSSIQICLLTNSEPETTSESASSSEPTNQTDENKKPISPSKHLGDIDNDGQITAVDARYALRSAVGLIKISSDTSAFRAVDVDGDGEITATDARMILRAAVGLETL